VEKYFLFPHRAWGEFGIGLNPHPDLVNEDSQPSNEVKRSWPREIIGPTSHAGRGRANEPKNQPDLSPPAGKGSRKIFGRGIGDHVQVPKSPTGRRRLRRGERELQVVGDLVHDDVLREEGDDAHRAAAARTMIAGWARMPNLNGGLLVPAERRGLTFFHGAPPFNPPIILGFRRPGNPVAAVAEVARPAK